MSTTRGAAWRPRAGATQVAAPGTPKTLEECLLEMAILRMTHPDSPASISYTDPDALHMGHRGAKMTFDFLWNAYPELGWISAMTTPRGVLALDESALKDLSRRGRVVLHLAPESGDPTVRARWRIPGHDADYHDAARRLRAGGIEVGVVFVLGAGGPDRSETHAEASAVLAGEMRPDHVTWLSSGAEGPIVGRRVVLDELRRFVGLAHLREALMTCDLTLDGDAISARLPSGRDPLIRRLDAARARADAAAAKDDPMGGLLGGPD